jgi:hypothetical protein
MSLSSVMRGSEKHSPKLSPRGEWMRDVLGAMNGTHTVKEIADLLVARHEELGRGTDVLEEVRGAAMRYAL